MIEDNNNSIVDVNQSTENNISNDISNKKNNKLKYVISILVSIILIIITAIVIFTEYDAKTLFDIIGNVYYRYVFIALILVLIYLITEGLALKVLLRSMQCNISFPKSFIYASIDFYFCAITPSATGGQPILAYYMTKDKISLANSSLAIIINTAFYKIVLLFLTIISMIFCSHIVTDSTLMLVLFIIGVIINAFVIFICFFAAFRKDVVEKIGHKCIRGLTKIKLIRKPDKVKKSFDKKMDEYEEGANFLKRKPLASIIAIIFNLIQRFAMFSVAYFVFLAFQKNFDLGHHSYMELFAIQVIIALCVDSLPLPGGVGISEYLYISLYEIIYSLEMIAPAMLLTRGIHFYFPLILTAIIVAIHHIYITIRNKKQGELESGRIL